MNLLLLIVSIKLSISVLGQTSGEKKPCIRFLRHVNEYVEKLKGINEALS